MDQYRARQLNGIPKHANHNPSGARCLSVKLSVGRHRPCAQTPESETPAAVPMCRPPKQKNSAPVAKRAGYSDRQLCRGTFRQFRSPLAAEVHATHIRRRRAARRLLALSAANGRVFQPWQCRPWGHAPADTAAYRPGFSRTLLRCSRSPMGHLAAPRARTYQCGLPPQLARAAAEATSQRCPPFFLREANKTNADDAIAAAAAVSK